MKITLKQIISGIIAMTLTAAILPVYANAENDTTVIYVSPNGSDTAEGTLNAPLKTLDGARQKVRKLNADNVEVYFKGGTYYIGETVTFDNQDAVKDGGSVTYKAYENEKVVFSGGNDIDGNAFEKVTDPDILKRIDASARDYVYQVKLSDIGIDAKSEITKTNMKTVETPSSTLLVQGDKLLQLAVWPNRGYASIGEVLPAQKGWSFKADSERIKRWTMAENAYLYGRFMYDWADGTVRVKSVDTANAIINTVDTAEYGIREGYDYSIYNLLEEIDMPGEWYLENKTGILYLYPDGNIKNSTFSLVTTTMPLISLDNTEGISFEGITFEKTRGEGIRITNGGGHSFKNCIFNTIGQQAVTINNGVKNRFDYCHFYELGKGGICITGGDAVNLVPSENNIENCLFEGYARISKKYSYAVRMYGVGDRVAHCRIHDGSHFAVYFLGNNNTIEYNDIYDVTQDASDSSAIYAGRSWVNGGTVVRHNYIHDCMKNTHEGRAGVYCDDWMTDVTIYGNVFANMNNGVSLHTSQFCTVENNLMINCRLGVTLNNRNYADSSAINAASAKIDKVYRAGTLKEEFRNVGYGDTNTMFNRYYERYNPESEVWNEQFPYLKTIFEAGKTVNPRNDIVRNNAFLKHKETFFHHDNTPFDLIEDGFECVYENNVVFEGEAPLKDEANGDYNLTDYSYIQEKIPEFIPFDITTVGIQNEEKLKLKDFELIMPTDGAADIDAKNTLLIWDTNSGADHYRLIIAKDKEFKNIVFNDLIMEPGGFKKLTNLRYGGQKYYWKVIALSNNYMYSENMSKECEKVYSFTTAMKENIDKTALHDIYNQAEKLYNKAEEGDAAGNYITGAKDMLKPYLEEADKILKDSQSTKKAVAYQQKLLTEKLNVFKGMKSAEAINIGTLMEDSEGWTSGVTVTKNSIISSKAGNYGYFPGRLFNTYNILKFRAKFSIQGTGYVSVGVRSANITVNPWLTTEYIFLVKNEVIELQKFNGDSKFYHTIPNDVFKDGSLHEVEFSAIDEDDSVRVKLIVDGKELFNVLDSDNPIKTGTGLHINNSNGSLVEIYN